MEILNKEEDIQNHINHAISNDNLELEIIIGSKESKNPINKDIFIKILNKLKNDYDLISESVNLDIRTNNNDFPSNTRCTILDLASIKRYCVTNSLEGITNILFIKKSNFKNEKIKNSRIVNEDYNYRINLKSEDNLDYDEKQIFKYNKSLIHKEKHFRYKKRYSFISDDKLFRFDLSIIKSTEWQFKQKKYEWAKTFKDADILNKPEHYELEIEYIGSTTKNDNGIIMINDYYNKLQNDIDNPILLSNSLSNPLSLVVNIEEKKSDKKESEYMQDTLLNLPEKQLNIKDKIIGKFIKIKDSYLNDNKEIKEIIEQNPELNITVIDYIDDYKNKGKHVQLIFNIKSLEKDKLFKELDKLFPEHNDVDFTPDSLVPAKKKDYINLLKQIQKLDDKNINIWISLNDIYSEYFDIEELILDSKIGQIGAGKSEDKELKFNKEKLNKLTDKCIELLNKHLLYLLEIIHNNKLILSESQKKIIIKRYKLLTNQKNKKYTEFTGPQPITLNYENLLLNNDINIVKGYAVTEKADGIRCLLFITENTGYLITSKIEIIPTGLKFPNVNGEWLLDGEYISNDRNGDELDKKLYMIFDIYYNGKMTPKPAHIYPWLNNDKSKNPTRLDLLNNFKELIQDIELSEIEHIRINIKEYEYGSLNLSDPNKHPDKFNSECKLIFEKCKHILDKQESYEYYIDGLILLPTYLGVKGNKINKSPENICGTWDYNFKWKPPEENTIDFKIITEKVGDSKKDKVYTINDEFGILKKYKKLNLITGYKEQEDISLDFCMKLLNNDKPSYEKTKKFHPPGEEESIGITNLLLEDNKLLCIKDKSEIKDGDIVEMRYNKNGLNNMIWEPLRVRHDKVNPNFQTVCNNVWKTITNPITNKLITGEELYDVNKIIDTIDKGYYISQNRSPETKILTTLHNYIKNSLICGVCSSFNKHIKYLDLSCGRGGDVEKYTNKDCNIKFVLGLDISNVNEACRRYFNLKDKHNTTGIFLQSDTSLNIKSNECNMDIDHSKVMIDILYGLTTKIPKFYNEINKKYNGLAKNKFDVISSQFSLHYYLKDEETFNGFLTNINENIENKGYFIATFYNGNKLFDILSEQDSLEYITENGDTIYKIKKEYDEEDFEYNEEDTENMFGNSINVYMDSIGQEIKEYLVNMKFLIDSFKTIGLKLVTPKPDEKYENIFKNKCIENGFGSFENVINELPNIAKDKKDKIFQDRYKEAVKITKDEKLKLLSGLNVYLIFQKE